jgi:hypothetical protein
VKREAPAWLSAVSVEALKKLDSGDDWVAIRLDEGAVEAGLKRALAAGQAAVAARAAAAPPSPQN